MAVNSSTWEADVERLKLEVSSGKASARHWKSEQIKLKQNNKANKCKRTGGMTQVIECFEFNPQSVKKIEKKKKEINY
jgi:hypothetical protein